jgi:hypothetical protein
MNPKHNICLILAFACVIFVSGTETQARDSHAGGRLIVQRVPNFGTNLVAQLSIDGRKIADIPRDQHYEGFVSAGHHVLTIQALPNTEIRRPTSMGLTVRSGHTYIFTATWESDRVVLRRSASASDTSQVSPIKSPTR